MLCCAALAGVGRVAELPVVVADPVGGSCSVARRRSVLRLPAIPPAAWMPAAPVGGPTVVVSLVLRHHRSGD